MLSSWAGYRRTGRRPLELESTLLNQNYELFGRVVCVYEPVQTKSFLHGRTEAARTMTAEAAHFVRPGTSPQ